MKLLLLFLTLALSANAYASNTSYQQINPQHTPVPYAQILTTGSYYDWGRGQDGWAHCYEWAYGGGALNGGQPVSNYLCDAVHPSYYFWGRSQNGYGYCYHWSAYGVALDNGQPASNSLCEAKHPSHYSWGRGNDGNTYCYQYTSNGYAMNDGSPVSNYLCR